MDKNKERLLIVKNLLAETKYGITVKKIIDILLWEHGISADAKAVRSDISAINEFYNVVRSKREDTYCYRISSEK